LKFKTTLLLFLVTSLLFCEVVTTIHIVGNTHTKDKIILREIHHTFPSDFDSEISQEDRNRLYNLGLFSTVKISQLDSIYYIYVKEAPRIIPIPMFEYDEASTNWSYGGGFINNNTNGLHRRLFMGATFGHVSAWIIDYEDPWVIGNHTSLKIRIVDFTTTDVKSEYSNKKQLLEIGSGFYKTKFHHYNYSIGWKKFKLTPIETFHIPHDKKIQYVFISSNYSYDTRDIHIDPTQGYFHNIGVHINHDLDGNLGYSQIEAMVNSYVSVPLPMFEPVFHFKSTLFMQKFNSTPLLFTQQYLGGEEGVRGYSPIPLDNNLDDAENLLETNNTLTFTFEFQQTLFPRKDYGGVELGIDWVLFSDIGFSADEPIKFSMSNPIIGFGCGFRFFASGMGVIGIDFGFNPYNQHFTHLSDGN